MVGVPGRSKACSTCRRRKKGCDFQRPACSQCRRAGLECGGYERGRIFVHSTPLSQYPSGSTGAPGMAARYSAFLSVLSMSRESSATPGSSSDVDGLSLSFDRDDCIRFDLTDRNYRHDWRALSECSDLSEYSNGDHFDARDDRDDHDDHDGHTGRHRRYARAVAIAHIVPLRRPGLLFPRLVPGADASLMGTAREELMLATFWESYLPNSTLFPIEAGGFASGGWTNVVQSLYRKDRVLHYTLMANCFSAASRVYGSRHMAEQSLRLHGRALHELRIALDNPKKARSDTVFSALRLMIVFSMFFNDRYESDRMARAIGWKEHNLGVLALLQARGPEAHVLGDGHQMFVDCRLALIVAAIRNRQRSPLNVQPWMTIPWRVIPKTPKDLLVDIMAGIPNILEGIDSLSGMAANDPGRDAFRRKIVSACWYYDRQLSNWYKASVPIERLHMLENSTEDGPLSTEDLSVVYIMVIFCTACLLLYSAMRIVGMGDLPPRSDMVTYVRKIGRYLKFFFHPTTGQYGLEMTSFPLGICLQTLYWNPHNTKPCDEEKAVFKELVETDRGREIMDFVSSMMKTFPV